MPDKSSALLLSPRGNINDEAVEAITWRVHELHLHFHGAALTATVVAVATPWSSNPTLCIDCSCFCCATQGLTGALGSRFGRELPPRQYHSVCTTSADGRDKSIRCTQTCCLLYEALQTVTVVCLITQMFHW
jgi:hypothetical protein